MRTETAGIPSVVIAILLVSAALMRMSGDFGFGGPPADSPMTRPWLYEAGIVLVILAMPVWWLIARRRRSRG